MKKSEITHYKLRPFNSRSLPFHREWVEQQLRSKLYPEPSRTLIREILEPLKAYDDKLLIPKLAVNVTRHQIEGVLPRGCGHGYLDIIARFIGIGGWDRMGKYGVNAEKEKAKEEAREQQQREVMQEKKRQSERRGAIKHPKDFFFNERPEFVERINEIVMNYENTLIHLVCQESPWGKLGEEAFVDSASMCMEVVLGDKDVRSEKMDFLAIRRLVFLLFAWNFRAILPSDVVVKNARYIPRAFRAKSAGFKPKVLEKYTLPKRD